MLIIQRLIMIRIIKNIIDLLDQKDKAKVKILVLFTFISAILESVSLAAFIPIIEFFSGESVLGINTYFENLNIAYLENINPIFIFVSLLLLVFLAKNLYLSFFYLYESKFVFQAKANLINNLFKNYIFQDYNFHVNKNSSKLIANLTVETDIFENCLSFLIVIIVDSILLFILFAFMFLINPFVSIILFLFSLVFLFSVYKILKKRTKKLGGDRVKIDAIRQKTLQQSFNGIKEIIVYDNRNYFVKYFSRLIEDIKSFVIKFTFINKFQKILIEMFVIITLIIFIILLVYQGNDISKITALIGVYLIAIIKIIPSINKTVASANYLQYASQSLLTLNDELNFNSKKFDEYKIDKNKKKINFKEKIDLINVKFQYPEKTILENINLEINKNNFLGVVGQTGSGKTTLCNLLLGLYEPTSGQIKSDNENIFENPKSYQRLIGYVPQHIFLLDDTIRNNITFGLSLDEEKILKVIKLAALENFIKNKPKGLDQIVGERGVKISGGEKQRIGIARALYREPNILILDEPTSALDENTEKSIINELINLKDVFTIVLITHKLSNLKLADKIIKIENKKIVNVK